MAPTSILWPNLASRLWPWRVISYSARMLNPLTPASKAANPTLLLTSTVGSSTSRHHGRRKHSSVDVQSSARTMTTDPASAQSTAPKMGNARGIGALGKGDNDFGSAEARELSMTSATREARTVFVPKYRDPAKEREWIGRAAMDEEAARTSDE
jgi:hypothetical protein